METQWQSMSNLPKLKALKSPLKAYQKYRSYYIAPIVKGILEKHKKLVLEKDFDRVYIIDGEEGSGKSLLGLQTAMFLDPTFNLDRVVFNGEDFGDAINKARKGQAIVFDEAFNGLASSGALSSMNRFIVTKLMECRQKNLFIIIILPTIFLLQKYAAIFRSCLMLHVYITKGGVRGYYRVYNKKNKKLLFLKGSKLYSYAYPKVRNSHRFYNKYPVDEMDYRKKKLEALEAAELKEASSRNYIRNQLVIGINRHFGKSGLEITEMLEKYKVKLSKTQVYKVLAAYNEKNPPESA